VKCYPNPFSDVLTIEILMSQRENLNVEIFDALGRKVAELYNGKHQGKMTLFWNGKNEYRQKAVEGIYFIHVNEHKIKLIRQ
jgi:flagellar hook assembly protein FlgD